MKQQKIRKIQYTSEKSYIIGVSIPNRFAHWESIMVDVSESGNCLILSSGCRPLAFNSKDIKTESKVMEKFIL